MKDSKNEDLNKSQKEKSSDKIKGPKKYEVIHKKAFFILLKRRRNLNLI